MKEAIKIRRLKVYETYGWKDKRLPKILLQGIWLEQCDFSIGDRFMVECKDGCLVITKTK